MRDFLSIRMKITVICLLIAQFHLAGPNAALHAESLESLSPELINKLKAAQAVSAQPQEKAPATPLATPPTAESLEDARQSKAAAEKEEKNFEDRINKENVSKPGGTAVELRRFGMDFFGPARKRVLTLEQSISKGTIPQALQKDALAGFIGPLDMISSYVNASIPSQYILNPGDQITIYYWGDLIELTTLQVMLNESGEASISKVGKFVARGMSLQQFQKAVQDQLQRVFGKDVKLIATLDSLKNIQVLIAGEAFRPGAYAVSAVTTLFNALYASGGPNEHGSLRDIKLIRNNKTFSVDFYDYLVKSDGRADYPLQAGDTIVFSRVGKLASIAGEVNRPALYELRNTETLRDLVSMANGIKPTGLKNKVHIQSVIPNRQKAVVDVDLSGKVPSADYELFDGDIVTIEVIIPEIKNVITLTGNVKVPGEYELKPNMRVADLFNEINEPWGEAYLERADVVRLDEDRKTTTIIPVNLGKALAKDPEHNIVLARFDRIIVYSKWDVKYYPERTVVVRGSVQKPGSYERSEAMKISDLLLKAGNILPDTFLDRADLLRYNFENNIYLTVHVDLGKLLSGNVNEDLFLSDRDALTIYSLRDARYIPPHEVEISGNVQRPGTYPRSEGMRFSDLLSVVGGPLPGSHHEVVIAKARTQGETRTLTINLDLLETGDQAQNVPLEDGDIVMVRKDSDFFDKPRWVDIEGEVLFPGRYPLVRKDDRLSELIQRAGGLTKRANPKGAVFLRKKELLPSLEQKGELLAVNNIVNVLNESEAKRLSARNMVLMKLEKGVEATGQGPALGIGGATVVGTDTSAKEAAALSLAPSIAQSASALTGGLVSAFSPGAAMSSQARKLPDEQLAQSARIIIDLKKALEGGADSQYNTALMNGDTISIPKKSETVSLVGAVMNPITVHLGKSRKVKKVVALAGGFASDADEERTMVLRVDGSIVLAEDTGNIEEGDIIYVPTKVVETEIITTTDKVINVIKYTLATAAGVIVFLALIP